MKPICLFQRIRSHLLCRIWIENNWITSPKFYCSPSFQLRATDSALIEIYRRKLQRSVGIFVWIPSSISIQSTSGWILLSLTVTRRFQIRLYHSSFIGRQITVRISLNQFQVMNSEWSFNGTSSMNSDHIYAKSINITRQSFGQRFLNLTRVC